MGFYLIMGQNNSGKSLYAENLAVENGNSRIYLATMQPTTEENFKRIEKHISQRSNKNFITIEKPVDICDVCINNQDVVLLEDVSNLLANEIYTKQNDFNKVFKDIVQLSSKCKCLIAVTISGMNPDMYSSDTSDYITQINKLNSALCNFADAVFTMENGNAVKIK